MGLLWTHPHRGPTMESFTPSWQGWKPHTETFSGLQISLIWTHPGKRTIDPTKKTSVAETYNSHGALRSLHRGLVIWIRHIDPQSVLARLCRYVLCTGLLTKGIHLVALASCIPDRSCLSIIAHSAHQRSTCSRFSGDVLLIIMGAGIRAAVWAAAICRPRVPRD